MRIYNSEYGDISSAAPVNYTEEVYDLLIILAVEHAIFTYPTITTQLGDGSVCIVYNDNGLKFTLVPSEAFTILDAIDSNQTDGTSYSPDEDFPESESQSSESENLEEEDSTEDSIENLDFIPNGTVDLSIDDSTSRFRGASWYKDMENLRITLAGVGGIGSWTALLISRLKIHQLRIYDPDVVNSVNFAGQFYDRSDSGKYKSYAISAHLIDFSGFYSSLNVRENFTATSPTDNILICGFDNMNARKEAFANWKHIVGTTIPDEHKRLLFIDGRLNAEEFQIFCIRGDDEYNMERYENEFLFDDREVSDAPCSYKQTSYCASMIASFITNLLVNHVHNLGFEEHEGQEGYYFRRDLPFFTSYNAETMFLKTEE